MQIVTLFDLLEDMLLYRPYFTVDSVEVSADFSLDLLLESVWLKSFYHPQIFDKHIILSVYALFGSFGGSDEKARLL